MLTEYNKRFNTLNSDLNKYKSRKTEYLTRDQAIDNARSKLDTVQDNLEKLEKKKEWITEEQKKDAWEKLGDIRKWIDDVIEK